MKKKGWGVNMANCGREVEVSRAKRLGMGHPANAHLQPEAWDPIGILASLSRHDLESRFKERRLL